MINQIQLNNILKEVIKQAELIGLDLGQINPIVDISRAKSWFGQCKGYIGKNQYQIRISKYHLNSDINAVKETIAHEICHASMTCRNHDKEWKRRADKMNRAYGYHIQRVAGYYNNSETNKLEKKIMSVPKNESKYVLKCTCCGKEYHRDRMSNVVKNPSSYRCGKCGETLKRIK